MHSQCSPAKLSLSFRCFENPSLLVSNNSSRLRAVSLHQFITVRFTFSGQLQVALAFENRGTQVTIVGAPTSITGERSS